MHYDIGYSILIHIKVTGVVDRNMTHNLPVNLSKT